VRKVKKSNFKRKLLLWGILLIGVFLVFATFVGLFGGQGS
jgi:hypothetical protein